MAAEQESIRQFHESTARDPMLNIDILCINCQEMIPCRDLESHSLQCDRVKEDVIIIENIQPMAQAEYKVQKLLKSLVRKRKTAFTPEDRGYYEDLIENANNLLTVRDYDQPSIARCREIMTNTLLMLDEFQGSPGALVYVDRLRILSKEKYNEMTRVK